MRPSPCRLTAGLCVAVLSVAISVAGALVRGEAVPRVPDEFSYLVGASALVGGRFAGPAPPLPAFFESPHILVHPTYASKYPPGQAAMLALGRLVTGHAIVGVWLSAAAAAAGVSWMLRSWYPQFELIGALVFVLQVGSFSYWNQSYWGGMCAAGAGAVVFGAIRQRHWSLRRTSVVVAIGIIALMITRPMEGLFALAPVAVTGAIVLRHKWSTREVLRGVLPAVGVLLLAIAALVSSDKAVTGKWWIAPYLLHERQYQESPPLSFLPMRSPIQYSSSPLATYYRTWEIAAYRENRSLRGWARQVSSRLITWWTFYMGWWLWAPIVLVGLVGPPGAQVCQWASLATISLFVLAPQAVLLRTTLLIAGFALQGFALWHVHHDLWWRLALGTVFLLLTEVALTKWYFPHYFAPGACLIIAIVAGASLRLASAVGSVRRWRGILLAILICKIVNVGVQIVTMSPGTGADRNGSLAILPREENWSVQRAQLQCLLHQYRMPSIVLVRYGPFHPANQEWVYNEANVSGAHVIWARDLGPGRNQALIAYADTRRVWRVDVPDGGTSLSLRSDDHLIVAPQPGGRRCLF